MGATDDKSIYGVAAATGVEEAGLPLYTYVNVIMSVGRSPVVCCGRRAWRHLLSQSRMIAVAGEQVRASDG